MKPFRPAVEPLEARELPAAILLPALAQAKERARHPMDISSKELISSVQPAGPQVVAPAEPQAR